MANKKQALRKKLGFIIEQDKKNYSTSGHELVPYNAKATQARASAPFGLDLPSKFYNMATGKGTGNLVGDIQNTDAYKTAADWTSKQANKAGDAIKTGANKAWDAVLEANMNKEVGVKESARRDCRRFLRRN